MRFLLSKFMLLVGVFLAVYSSMLAAEKQFVSQISYLEKDTLFRHKYAYDKYGRVLMEIKTFEKASVWNNLEQKEWFYYGDKCISVFEKRWTNNSWQNAYSVDYQYSGDLLTEEIHNEYANNKVLPLKKLIYNYASNKLESRQTSIWQNEAWIVSLEEINHYGLTGKLDSVQIKSYKSGGIEHQFLLSNSYDEQGRLSLQLFQEIDNQSKRLNVSMVNWYYVASSTQVFSQRNKIWNSEVSTWVSSQRMDYAYTPNEQISKEILQSWNHDYWKGESRYDYLYNSDGNFQKKEELKPIYNLWRTTHEINYLSDASTNSESVDARYGFWGGITGEVVSVHIPYFSNDVLHFVKAKSLDIVYVNLTIVEEFIDEPDSIGNFITVYPNPSDGYFYFNNQQYNVLSWSVNNLNGTVLKQKNNFDHSGIVDISALPRGIYLLVANTPNKSYVQKLIKH